MEKILRRPPAMRFMQDFVPDSMTGFIGKETMMTTARRAFGIPVFRFYASSDGVKMNLFGQLRGLRVCFTANESEIGRGSPDGGSVDLS
jgi:hypothetical protein